MSILAPSMRSLAKYREPSETVQKSVDVDTKGDSLIYVFREGVLVTI